MPTSTGLYDTSTITYDQSSLSYDGYPAPLTNLPAVGVYVAFTDGPYVAEPVWTDVSYLTRDVSIRRGRQDDLQQFPSGQCSITFDNRDRYFDPFNTASPAPFNGNLKPRRQVKVVAIWNGVSYPLFRGFVAGWPVEYTEAGLDSTVTVDCFDLMGLIGSTTVDRPVVDEYILSLNPRNYFPMSESPSINKWQCRISPDYYFQEAGTVIVPGPGGSGGTLPWTASSFYNVNSLKPAVDSPAVGGTINFQALPIVTPNAADSTTVAGDFSIAMVLEVPNFSGSLGYFQFVFSRTRTVYVEVDSNGLLKAYTLGASTTTYGDVRDRKGMTVVVTYSVSTNKYTVYVNGDVGVTGSASGGTAGIFPLTGTSLQFMYLNYGTKVQHVALWDRQLTQTESHTLSEVFNRRWEMTTPNRATYYLAATPTPTALYNLSSSIQSTVSEIPTEPSTLIPTLQTLVDTEGGQLFVDKSGVLQFLGQNDVFGLTRCNTSQVTFTDTGIGVNYDNTPIRMQFDADQVRNQVTVNATDDQAAIATDSTSITTFGVAADVVETLLPDAVDAQSLASYRLSIFKNPKLALDPFMAKGQQDPAYNWPLLLNLELLDRVTFKRTPSVGSAVQRDLLVQSVEHRITPGTWETVVNGSTRYTGWFIIGTSLLGSSEDVLL